MFQDKPSVPQPEVVQEVKPEIKPDSGPQKLQYTNDVGFNIIVCEVRVKNQKLQCPSDTIMYINIKPKNFDTF